MNNLLGFIIVLILGLSISTSNFNKSVYISDNELIEKLNEDFVKECNSDKLIETLEIFLSNYIDEISHITSHHEKSRNIYYYTVYGTKDDIEKIEMVEVDKLNFSASNFYEFENILGPGACKKKRIPQDSCPINCAISFCRGGLFCVIWACNGD